MRLMRKLEATNISVKDKSQAVLLERAVINWDTTETRGWFQTRSLSVFRCLSWFHQDDVPYTLLAIHNVSYGHWSLYKSLCCLLCN